MRPVFADPKTDFVFKRIFGSEPHKHPPALDQEPFRESLEVARIANFTEEEWESYDRAKMAEQDLRGVVSAALKEGLERGRSEGRAEGLAEGLERGRSEGQVNVLLRLVEQRFGPPAEALVTRIRSATEEQTLGWIERILTAERPEDVFQDREWT